MENKYLVLKGCAGLGNRLITLMKAIKYCKKTKRTLYVDWADGMFSGIGDNAFFKYFELRNIDYVKDLSLIKDSYQKGASTYPKKMRLSDLDTPVIRTFNALTPRIAQIVPYKVLMTLFFKEKTSYFVGLQSWQRTVYTKNKYINAIKNRNDGENFVLGSALTARRKEDIVFFADFRPLVSIKNLFDYISLKQEYLDKINDFANQNRIRETIGVHIRYTDKKPKSKIERLKKQIDAILKENSEQKIFLCSDNNDVIEDFLKRYGENIIQRPKYIPKTNNQGIHIWAAKNLDAETKEKMMEDSIMDMWLLAMTKELYWQGNSSFSYISKYIKNDKQHTHNWMGFIR